jgi:hypothetical protein
MLLADEFFQGARPEAVGQRRPPIGFAVYFLIEKIQKVPLGVIYILSTV